MFDDTGIITSLYFGTLINQPVDMYSNCIHIYIDYTHNIYIYCMYKYKSPQHEKTPGPPETMDFLDLAQS